MIEIVGRYNTAICYCDEIEETARQQIQGTLDESPMAYKGIDAILSQIGPTAEVVRQIKPVYNYKAG